MTGSSTGFRPALEIADRLSYVSTVIATEPVQPVFLSMMRCAEFIFSHRR
jgi:hypothetical protein